MRGHWEEIEVCVKCLTCHGAGTENFSVFGKPPWPCPDCSGRGFNEKIVRVVVPDSAPTHLKSRPEGE